MGGGDDWWPLFILDFERGFDKEFHARFQGILIVGYILSEFWMNLNGFQVLDATTVTSFSYTVN